MNKHTLENILIFAIIFKNTYINNNGVIFNSYLDKKSSRFLGFNISEFKNLTIDDFMNKNEQGELSNIKDLDAILNSLVGNGINLTDLSNEKNVFRETSQTDITNINGLDFYSKTLFKYEYSTIDSEYFIQILRKYKLLTLLNVD